MDYKVYRTMSEFGNTPIEPLTEGAPTIYSRSLERLIELIAPKRRVASASVIIPTDCWT